MPSLDPRQPVIVGAGQITRRPGEGEPLSPLELMAAAARAALQDAGAAVLERVQRVSMIDCVSWPVPDPGAALAAELGLGAPETDKAVVGGDSPIRALGSVCSSVQAGELDVALICGAEALLTLARALREGRDPGWTQAGGGDGERGRAEAIEQARESAHPAEQAAGLIAPIMFYPLFESVVRGAAGRDPASHLQWLGRLWGRFADVARANPHA